MEPITQNPNRIPLDEAYMQMAEIWARRSKANRKQVGALIVKDKQIISDGYNGMPAGDPDDTCEEWVYPDDYDGRDGIGGPPSKILRTKQEVLHAESNALAKIAENGGVGAQGATLYVTMSPCKECAKLIKQAKITRVVFRELYRDAGGIEFLLRRGVQVEQLSNELQPVPAPAPVQAPQARPVSNPAFQQLRQIVNTPPPAVQPVQPPAPAPVEYPQEDVAALLAQAERMMQNDRVATATSDPRIAEARARAKAMGFDDIPVAVDTPYRSQFQ